MATYKRTIITVECDKCNDVYEADDTRTQKEARNRMTGAGWAHFMGKDLCEECLHVALHNNPAHAALWEAGKS
jgi:hypothetical protein